MSRWAHQALLTATFIGMVVMGMCLYAYSIQPKRDREYCECMGRQPYIMTKFYEGRCLMNVLSYEELDIVQYLFICEGRCR